MCLPVVIYRAVSGCSCTQEPERKICIRMSGKSMKVDSQDKWSSVDVNDEVK